MLFSWKKFLAWTFAFLVLVSSVLGFLIYDELSDLNRVKAMVTEELEKQTHRKVSIGQAEVNFSKGLNVRLTDVSLHSEKEGKPEFSAGDVWISMKLWPLLNQRVEIDKIVVQNSMMHVTRDAKGRFNYEDLKALISNRQASPPKSENWGRLLNASLMQKLELRDGQILFRDAGKKSALQLAHLNLKASTPANSHVTISLQGELVQPKKNAAFNVVLKINNAGDIQRILKQPLEGSVQVDDLQFARIRPYFPDASKFPILETFPQNGALSLTVDISGRAGAGWNSQGQIRTVSYDKNPAARFISASERLNGNVDYQLSVSGDRVEFKRMKYRVGDFQLEATGALTGLKTDAPGVKLSLVTNQFKADYSDQYPPLKIVPPKVHKLLQKVFKKGTLEVHSLRFDGSLDEFRNISQPANLKKLNGELLLRGVDWAMPLPPFLQMTGTMGLDNGDTVIDVYRAKYEGLPVSKFQGKIAAVTAGAPNLDWKIESSLKLANLQTALPKILRNPNIEKLLGQYKNMKGNGLLRLNIQGPMNEFHKIKFFGDLDFQDGSFNKDDWDLPVAVLNGRASYEIPPTAPPAADKKTPRPWQVAFKDLSGNYGTEPFDNVTGDLTLENGQPYLKYSGELDLNPADSYARWVKHSDLDPASRAFSEKIRVRQGGIKLKFLGEGNPLDSEKTKRWGSMEIRDLAAELPDGMPVLLNISGAMNYDDRKVSLKNISGFFGDSPLEMNARFNKKSGKFQRGTIRVKSAKLLSRDLKTIPSFRNLNYAGPVATELFFDGSMSSYKFDHRMDLTKASYRFEDVLDKPARLSNALRLRGQTVKGQSVKFEEMEYALGGAKVRGRATLKSFDDPEFAGAFEIKDLDVHSLSKNIAWLKDGQAGTADVKIKAKGNLRNVQQTRFEGETRFTELKILPAGFQHTARLNGAATFTNDRLNIQKTRLESGKSRFNFKGIYKPGARPDLNLSVRGKTLDLNDLLAKSGDAEQSLRKTIERNPLLAKGASTLKLDVNRLNYKFWRLENVAGRMTFKDKKLEVQKFDIYPPDDQPIKGQGQLSFQDPKTLEFESYLLAKNSRAENFFRQFGEDFDGALSGKMKTLELILSGRGENLKDIKKSLVGKFTLDMGSGALRSSRLKQGFAKLMAREKKNYDPSVEEEEVRSFRQVAGDFSIRQGVAQTKNFQYRQPARSASLVGWFDLNRHTLDAVVGVTPLPGLDKLLSKIPLLGKIITAGEEESLVRAYYSVRGKFSKPEVSAIPFTSLERKLKGTFQGILQTPQEILTLPREILDR